MLGKEERKEGRKEKTNNHRRDRMQHYCSQLTISSITILWLAIRLKPLSLKAILL